MSKARQGLDLRSLGAANGRKKQAKAIADLKLEKYALELEMNGLTVVPPEVTGITMEQCDRMVELLLARGKELCGVNFTMEDGPTEEVEYTNLNVLGAAGNGLGGEAPPKLSQIQLVQLAQMDREFRNLAINPVALTLIRQMIGFDETRLSSTNSFVKWKGGGYGSNLGMHCDQASPLPWGRTALNANVNWCLTDYTKEGGALAYVPGSHHRPWVKKAPGRLARGAAEPREGTRGAEAMAALGLNLPREIIKWLQSLDLSFCVKNPKRDFSNGYLIAEILSRYYPKDINMNNYENGQRLAAKCDNWEQIYKVFKRKGINIAKQEFDAVIHCAPGAAPAFIFHLYNALTKRTVKDVVIQPDEPVPAFMRDTASKRLKDHEIHRIQDNVERTIRAIDTLGVFHDERRMQKAAEAPLLIRQERRMKSGMQGTEFDTSSKEEMNDSVRIDEVRVKALTGSATQLRGKEIKGEKQKTAAIGKSTLLKAVTLPRTSAGALAGMQQPALIVKPAADIMRPMVLSIIQESEELAKLIDSKKDVVVSFMEQCREGMPYSAARDFNRGDRTSAPPLEQKMREIEETSIKVFETLANRAQLLVDTLTKSPPEFWKVWSTFYLALADFSESSPIFASAVFFFKRLGDLMRDADAPLTQQLVTEVGLPSLAKELSRSPEKRECLCEIIYSYTQEDTLNHLLVLRALKEKVGDNLPVYVSCLSCLISQDAHLGLLDEHLLDLYVYYALVAMQSPQPRIRVAGISILSTIVTCSAQHMSIVALIPNFGALANDEWWEVQAQLLLLSAHLLSKLSVTDHDNNGEENDDHSASSKVGDQAADEMAMANEEAIESLLSIINRLFVVSTSKNVLQVGLSALVHLLSEYTNLLPMFVTVLLEQPPALRQRLLRPAEAEAAAAPDRTLGRRTYVMGNSSRMYEEKCISSLWPHLDVAKTLTRQLEASALERLELEHMEVLEASLPEEFDVVEIDEWSYIFDKVKQYVFAALVDPELHLHSTAIIKKFWLCTIDKVSTRSIEASKKNLLQALRFLYSGGAGRACVDEAAVLKFLKELKEKGGNVQLEVTSVVESFQETHPDEYKLSQLGTVFP